MPDETEIVGLNAGAGYTCALTVGGEANCWGANAVGQLGDGTTSRRWTPTRVASDARFVQLALGGSSACGLTDDGRVLCWGRNQNGQLGRGTYSFGDFDPSPRPVSGSRRYVRVSGGGIFCAVSTDGRAYCWGGVDGLFGGGDFEGRCEDGYFVAYASGTCARPTPVASSTPFGDVTVGGVTACGRNDNGSGSCWGVGYYGELGGAPSGPAVSIAPSPVAGGFSFEGLAGGAAFWCGLVDARAYCWGNNFRGQLGLGDTGSEGSTPIGLEPTVVVGGHVFRELAAGGAHACGVDGAGSGWCWGDNGSGQLGQPHATRQTGTPQRVEGVVADGG